MQAPNLANGLKSTVMSKIKAILFDLNETLLHQRRTERSHIAYTYAAAASAGWELTFEDFEQAWLSNQSNWQAQWMEGIQLLRRGDLEAARQALQEPWYRQNIAAILASLHFPAPHSLVEKLTWAFQDSWMGGLSLLPGSRTALHRLSQAGYPLALVTNFQQADIIPEILERFELAGCFEVVEISSAAGVRKPHPDLFNLALEKLGLAGQHQAVLHIGDNLVDDVEGAHLAGLIPVWINPDQAGGCGSKPCPSSSLPSLQELPGLVSRLEV